MVIVLFGVTGSGKTTVGKLLSDSLGWQFLDADDYHSPGNVAKMACGIPLDDDDRLEWLDKLSYLVESRTGCEQNAVLACSALKTAYREKLGAGNEVRFILLEADFETIRKRLCTRTGHFMDPRLLQSQFETLEVDGRLDMVIDASVPPGDCVTRILPLLLDK